MPVEVLTIAVVGLGIFTRFFIALKLMPLPGTGSLPISVAGALASVITIFLSPRIMVLMVAPFSFGAVALLLVKEACVGALLGMSVRLCWSALFIAGGITNSFALVGTNTQDGSIAYLGKLYFMVAAGVFWLLDGHHVFVQAFVRSVELLPTAATDNGLQQLNSSIFELILKNFAGAFQFGVLVSAPIFVTALVTEMLLAFWARLQQIERNAMVAAAGAWIVQISLLVFLWKTVTMLARHLDEQLTNLGN